MTLYNFRKSHTNLHSEKCKIQNNTPLLEFIIYGKEEKGSR